MIELVKWAGLILKIQINANSKTSTIESDYLFWSAILHLDRVKHFRGIEIETNQACTVFQEVLKIRISMYFNITKEKQIDYCSLGLKL